jgi:hypothetical protein
MQYSRLRLPWKRLKKGQGFFVPCLDFEKMRQHGLSRAISMRILDAQAKPGVMAGVAGVWFYRPRPATSLQAKS